MPQAKQHAFEFGRASFEGGIDGRVQKAKVAREDEAIGKLAQRRDSGVDGAREVLPIFVARAAHDVQDDGQRTALQAFA